MRFGPRVWAVPALCGVPLLTITLTTRKGHPFPPRVRSGLIAQPPPAHTAIIACAAPAPAALGWWRPLVRSLTASIARSVSRLRAPIGTRQAALIGHATVHRVNRSALRAA